jgi:hypothetical protein
MTKHRTRPEEPAHDILAAEEFGVPAPDPTLHRGPVTLPGDPTGIVEPHDVLAAEEFALPAPRNRIDDARDDGRHGRPSRAALLVAGALAVFAARRRARRGRRT